MGRELTEAALLAEMLKHCGPIHTTTLLGVATAAGLLGVNTSAEFLSMRFGSRASRYRWLRDFRDLADFLRAEGYDLSELDEDMPAGVVLLPALS